MGGIRWCCTACRAIPIHLVSCLSCAGNDEEETARIAPLGEVGPGSDETARHAPETEVGAIARFERTYPSHPARPRYYARVLGVLSQKDEQIAKSPLANMIRNPRCMYHVPYKPAKVIKKSLETARPELELEDAVTAGGVSPTATASPGAPINAIEPGENESVASSEDDDDDEDED